MLYREGKTKITEIYNQIYAELKEKYEGKNIPIMTLNNIIKRNLRQTGLTSKENIIYIRGYFRKNRVLVYDFKTMQLKWNI